MTLGVQGLHHAGQHDAHKRVDVRAREHALSRNLRIVDVVKRHTLSSERTLGIQFSFT